MNRVLQEVLIGEAGDLVVKRYFHQLTFPSIPYEELRVEDEEEEEEEEEFSSEEDRRYYEYWKRKIAEEKANRDDSNDYIRLLGLPPVKDIFSNIRHPILAVTIDGNLMMISDNYPAGFPIELDIPPIEKIASLVPTGFLDINGTIHFIDIGAIVDEQSNKTIDMSMYYNNTWNSRWNIPNPTIDNVRYTARGKEISAGSRGLLVSGLIILTNDNQLMYGSSLNIIKGDIKTVSTKNMISIKSDVDKLIGGLILYQNGLMSTSVLMSEGSFYPKVATKLHYKLKDAIMRGQTTIYTIDEDGVLRECTEKSEKIIETKFNPVRLMIDGTRYGGNVCMVEDSDGNVYELPGLKNMDYPIRLLNPNKL